MTYTGLVGRNAKQRMVSKIDSPALTTDSNQKFEFLRDDVRTLPEHVISYIEGLTSQTPAVIVSGDTESYSFDNTPHVSVYNQQTRDNPVETGMTYRYPWKYVAEPFKSTTLKIETGSIDGEENALWFKWLVDGHVQSYGPSVDVLFTTLGEHDIVVTVKDETSGTPRFIIFKVMCKYIRREVRKLTDLDREMYFNAVSVMSRVPTEVGQRLYGPKYKSKDYFTRLHLYYGGTNDCDHWHAGAGFVTSHVTLTLEFEQAVQSIFPSIGQPYWDFTLESTFYDAYEFRRSPVFSESWFGDASPDNSMHTITEARWAFSPAMANAKKFSQVYNSYGILRAPWNSDPTPFMTRSEKVYGLENNLKPSGCTQYYVATQKDNWMGLAQQLTSAAHGHIHETIGGAFNQNEIPRLLKEQETPVTAGVYTFSHQVQPLAKIMWRSGVTVCPEECSMSTAATDCECKLDAEKYADANPADVLDEAGVLPLLEFYDKDGEAFSTFYKDEKEKTEVLRDVLPGKNEDESRQIYQNALQVLSKPGHIGDMFQASSTNDIMFWVLHGTVDRLWHFKQLGNQKNFDPTWTSNNTCYCHNPQDYQPFKSIFDDKGKYYTNEELVDLLSASRDGMPYLYDNFEWDHCRFLGFPMENAHYTYSALEHGGSEHNSLSWVPIS